MTAGTAMSYRWKYAGMSLLTRVLFLLPILTTGCVPFPHTERTASEINGTLVDVDTPPGGVRVKRVLPPYRIVPAHIDTDRPLCERPGEEVIVDAGGHFHFDQRNSFYPVLVLYGVASPSVTICVDTGGGLTEAWHEGFYRQTPPQKMALVCKPETVSHAVKCEGP